MRNLVYNEGMESGDSAIVCVDDEAVILMSLKMLLRKRYGRRFRYEGAADASSALSIVEDLIADGVRVILIISDWLMPGMNGDAFLRIVHERHPGIKAIMVSGRIDEDSIRKLEEEGLFSGFLTKPFAPTDFYALVDALVLAD
jgi:DNA-binding NtrC family response regulator